MWVDIEEPTQANIEHLVHIQKTGRSHYRVAKLHETQQARDQTEGGKKKRNTLKGSFKSVNFSCFKFYILTIFSILKF